MSEHMTWWIERWPCPNEIRTQGQERQRPTPRPRGNYPGQPRDGGTFEATYFYRFMRETNDKYRKREIRDGE